MLSLISGLPSSFSAFVRTIHWYYIAVRLLGDPEVSRFSPMRHGECILRCRGQGGAPFHQGHADPRVSQIRRIPARHRRYLSRRRHHPSDPRQSLHPHPQAATDWFGHEDGGWLWSRFTVHHTPKHGSWLNQAEIEIGLFSRQCLGPRRISRIEDLASQAHAWNQRTNQTKPPSNGKSHGKRPETACERKHVGHMRQGAEENSRILKRCWICMMNVGAA